MDVCRPLRAALFFYEAFRVLLLVFLLFIAPLEGGFSMGSSARGGFFPYLVYLSSNALFPLMALFVWLRPEEYRPYLTLYMAGKIIGVVSFYVWEFFSFRNFSGMDDVVKSIILLGGSVFINFADVLSVGGAWALKNKFRQALPAIQMMEPSGRTECGGV